MNGSRHRAPLLAIDGPAGSGKSTIAKALAAHLGVERLDTGAMYRAVTLLVLESGADPADGRRAAELAGAMDLALDEHVLLNGSDVTDEIRSGAVDSAVSVVAAHPAVRAILVERQRQWGRTHGGGVVEGRDIGTAVFPEADLKVFLTADPHVRSSRRLRQAEDGGAADPGQGSIEELERRDRIDSNRAASPLKRASDAIVVDSTHLSVDDVVKEVLSHL